MNSLAEQLRSVPTLQLMAAINEWANRPTLARSTMTVLDAALAEAQRRAVSAAAPVKATRLYRGHP